MPGHKNPPAERDFYRPSEVAQRWGCTKMTVNAMVRRGLVPCMNFRGVKCNFIPAAWVDSIPLETVRHWIENEGGDGAVEFGRVVEAVEPSAAEPRPSDPASD
jgi:hypothetical protein